MTCVRSLSPFCRCFARHLAHHHRVHGFEVRRVGGEREVDLAAGLEHPVGRGAEMVLDVARAQNVVGDGAALELGEDRGIGLAHHVGQHVEPATMGHAQHDLVRPEPGRGLDDRLQRRDGALAAIEAEALGARELDVQELLETPRSR